MQVSSMTALHADVKRFLIALSVFCISKLLCFGSVPLLSLGDFFLHHVSGSYIGPVFLSTSTNFSYSYLRIRMFL